MDGILSWDSLYFPLKYRFFFFMTGGEMLIILFINYKAFYNSLKSMMNKANIY